MLFGMLIDIQVACTISGILVMPLPMHQEFQVKVGGQANQIHVPGASSDFEIISLSHVLGPVMSSILQCTCSIRLNSGLHLNPYRPISVFSFGGYVPFETRYWAKVTCKKTKKTQEATGPRI
jgi:hypothetical protein